jgi:ribA/ribD-fused uncharacterized protein
VLLFYSHRNGKFSAFSQWNQNAPFVIRLKSDNGHKKSGSQIRFYNNEQYMMYHKAILFKDYSIANQILATRNPKLTKAYGRKVGQSEGTWDEGIWDDNKFSIVTEGTYLKFSQNDRFKAILLSTGDDIIGEASPSDAVWGIGIGETHPNARDPEKWAETGQNLLGKALMEVRFRLRKDADPKNEKIKRTNYPGQSDIDDEQSLQDHITTTNQEIRRQAVIDKLSQNFNVNPDDF